MAKWRKRTNGDSISKTMKEYQKIQEYQLKFDINEELAPVKKMVQTQKEFGKLSKSMLEECMNIQMIDGIQKKLSGDDESIELVSEAKKSMMRRLKRQIEQHNEMLDKKLDKQESKIASSE